MLRRSDHAVFVASASPHVARGGERRDVEPLPECGPIRDTPVRTSNFYRSSAFKRLGGARCTELQTLQDGGQRAPSSDSAGRDGGANRHDCKGTRPWNLPRQLTRDFDHDGVWLELKSSGTADLLGPVSAGYLPMSCSTVSVRSDQPIVVAR